VHYSIILEYCAARYHIKILLGDLNVKVGREDIFKPIIANESLHGASNNNGIRVVNFTTSKTNCQDYNVYEIHLDFS
jgi:hypothetical protein